MAKPDDISGLFTPEDQSAALIFLRRLVGCTFDYIWTAGGGTAASNGGSCDNTNDILAQLIETLNWAMLAVIAVVATYLIFVALLDTANDGEAGGRRMNAPWTLIGAALGAILCFPAFNGFSALQMATMQVTVWSVGLGDSTWKIAASGMANANTVNAAFASKPDDGWFYYEPSTEKALREQIAAGLATRVAGEVCRVAITKGTSSLAAVKDGSVTTVSPPPTFLSAEDGYTQTVLTYQAGEGLNSSAGLCGSVNVSYASERKQLENQSAGTLTPGNTAAQAELSRASARFQAQASKAGADALLQSIRTEGDSLYQKLFPNNAPRLRGQDQLNAIQAAVTKTIDGTKTSMQGALKQAPAEFKQHAISAMSGNQQNGWLYAVLYQRVLVNATTSLSQLGLGGIEVASNQPVEDLRKAFGCGGWFENRCSNELEVFFDDYKRDTLALAEIAPAFRNAAQNTAIQGVNSATIGGTNAGGVSASKWLNDIMLDLADVKPWDGQGWVDPIPELQATGGKILTYGLGILTVATGGSIAANIPNPATMIVGELVALIGPIGWAFVAIGFALAVIVPFMPLVYFFLAALSWFILAVQTIITSPFWIMKMFYPNRDGSLSGTSFASALNVLLVLLVRPALIIVGLVFCMILMRVGLDFLNFLATNSFTVLASNAGGMMAGAGNIALALGGFLIYMSLAVTLVSICCGLIDGVADVVSEAIETGASRLVGSLGGRSESALGSPAAGMATGLAIGNSRARGSLSGTTRAIANLSKGKSQGNLGGTQK